MIDLQLLNLIIQKILNGAENKIFDTDVEKTKYISDFKYLCNNTLKFNSEKVEIEFGVKNNVEGSYHSYNNIIYENN